MKGRINDSYVVFTIDTGASRTILSKSVFDGLETKPELHPTTGILNACGREVRVFGEAKFTLILGDFLADQHIIVADIDDDCLLGVDVLYAEQNMPAEILLSEGILKLRNKEILINNNNIDDFTIKLGKQSELSSSLLTDQSKYCALLYDLRHETWNPLSLYLLRCHRQHR